MDQRPVARDRFIGLTKAARDLGLGKRTLRAAVDRGELTTYVFGQRARVKVSDLRSWLEAHRRGGR
jgi:excisionase family DNA binding protein